MPANDRTIFSYLNPSDDNKLSSLNNNDISEILAVLNKYYLEYREVLGIPSDITFGIEIEMEHFKGTVNDFWPFELGINDIVGNTDWTVKNDITLRWGREIASEICMDSSLMWNNIKRVCEYASEYGEIDTKCAGHINIGSQILGNNPLYWYRFLKLWTAYENIIYRFGYGEFLTSFPFISYSGKPIAKTFYDNMELFRSKINDGVFSVINCLKTSDINVDFLKKNAVSFYKMYDGISDYSKLRKNCVVEIRNNLGTLDEVIWQNYNNFYINLMLYCKNDQFDDDIIDRRIAFQKDTFSDMSTYDKIYLDQAIELSDLIFKKNVDKLYFLRQYIKTFEIAMKPCQRARKFTATDR